MRIWYFESVCEILSLRLESEGVEASKDATYKFIDILCIFGAPFVPQSDCGREFANRIIENLTDSIKCFKEYRWKHWWQ